MCNRFGFRMTTMLGCVLMIVGLGASYFISSYIGFLLLYGIMTGCGTSFIQMVANVATGFWFDSKRTIAISIVSSASGASVLTVAASNYIDDEWGWRYCFPIWAACLVVLFVASFLLAPPPMVELESAKPLVGPTKKVDVTRITGIIPLEYDNARVRKISERKLRYLSRKTGIPLGRMSRPSVLPAPQPVGLGRYFRFCLCCSCCQQSIGSRPLYRKDIFYEGSMYYVMEKEDEEDEGAFPLTMSKLPTTRDVEQEVHCHCTIPEAFTRAVTEMLDWSLLLSPIFLLLLLASLLIYVVRYIPFLVIKKYNAPYMDYQDAAQTTRMMGIGSFCARLSIGFVLYFFHKLSALAATIFVTLSGGTVLCCLTLSHSVGYQIGMCFMAGFLTSTVITLRSLIIIDLLGINKLTSCTGVLFFFQGLASFVGMPMAEILREMTGSHDASLIFCGVGYILAGLCNIILAFVSIRIKKK